jgi:Novel toxin 15
VKAIGEPAVKVLETAFDIVVTLVKEGPAAAWEKIKESLSNLKEMLMGMILDMVKSTIIEIAITKILSFLSPVGAFIQAIIAIYNTVMFFIERLKTIGQVVASFIDSIAAIAAGNIGSAAARVESTMAGLLTLVISFLARFIGLGKVSDKVKEIIQKIRAPIDKALDKVIDWIVTMAKKVGKFFAQAGTPKEPEQKLEQGLAAATTAVNALSGATVTAGLITPVLGAIKIRYGFKTLIPVVDGNDWWVEGEVNPKRKRKTAKKSTAGAGTALTPMPQKAIEFTCNTAKYNKTEYQGQLDGQAAGLNQIPLDKWTQRRQDYRDKGRPSEAAAAQEAARQLKRDELAKTMTPAQVEKEMAKLAALHEPDLVAGGHYTIAKLGNRFINSSIGSQWRTRVKDLDDAVAAVAVADHARTQMNAKLKAV